MSRSTRFMVAIALSAAVLALTGCATRVPEVRGKSLRQAGYALGRDGFALGDVRYDQNALAPRGTVVAQSPRAGAFARKGRLVALTVAGDAPLAVPDTVGMTRSEALAALAVANIKCGGVTERFDEAMAYGRVVEQSAEPGTRLADGNEVELVVSAGPEGSSTASGTARPGQPGASGSATGTGGRTSASGWVPAPNSRWSLTPPGTNSGSGSGAGSGTGAGSSGGSGSGSDSGAGSSGGTGSGAGTGSGTGSGSGGTGTGGGSGSGSTGGSTGSGSTGTGTGSSGTGGWWTGTGSSGSGYTTVGMSRAAVFKYWIKDSNGNATDLCYIYIDYANRKAYCPFAGLDANTKIYAVKRSDGLWIVTAIR